MGQARGHDPTIVQIARADVAPFAAGCALTSDFIKNLIYFVFIFSFAMLRLWVTLLILTYGLKLSYVRGV